MFSYGKLVWSSQTRDLIKRLERSGKLCAGQQSIDEPPRSYLEGFVAGAILLYMIGSVGWIGSDILAPETSLLWVKSLRLLIYAVCVLVRGVLSLNAVGPIVGCIFRREVTK